MPEIQRIFTITEVSRLMGISPQTLRNWEKIAVVPQSHKRGIRGARYWLESEIEEIRRYRQENYRW